jgi:hypothetical protein
MPLIAVYDACVLHPAPVRNLLLRLAVAGVVQARWTERILDECFASIRDALDHPSGSFHTRLVDGERGWKILQADLV